MAVNCKEERERKDAAPNTSFCLHGKREAPHQNSGRLKGSLSSAQHSCSYVYNASTSIAASDCAPPPYLRHPRPGVVSLGRPVVHWLSSRECQMAHCVYVL